MHPIFSIKHQSGELLVTTIVLAVLMYMKPLKGLRTSLQEPFDVMKPIFS